MKTMMTYDGLFSGMERQDTVVLVVHALIIISSKLLELSSRYVAMSRLHCAALRHFMVCQVYT